MHALRIISEFKTLQAGIYCKNYILVYANWYSRLLYISIGKKEVGLERVNGGNNLWAFDRLFNMY